MGKKIVVNRCYGGFGLSEAAMKLYAAKKGIELFPSCSDGMWEWWTVPPGKRDPLCDQKDFHSWPMEKRQQSNKAVGDSRIFDFDIPRDDAALVAVVEELGHEANGETAKLEVVEIPDDVEWVISDYDGMEKVEEAHRSW